MHARGILQSLDESRYRCIMAGNKEMNSKERRTKTSLFALSFCFLCAEPSWTQEAAVCCKTSYTVDVLLAVWSADEIVSERELYVKHTPVVNEDSLCADKTEVFSSYTKPFCFLLKPDFTSQLSAESVTLWCCLQRTVHTLTQSSCQITCR